MAMPFASLYVLIILCSCVLGDYLLGVGRYDITGPAVQIEMMGMANPKQIARGIHFRQYSRAYIIADLKNPQTRVVFVSIDACMGTQIMKMKVIEQLKTKYGDLYTNDNVCISGTHTHSGPAGYFQYLLYEVTSLGFVQETLDSLVDGIVGSISRAHDDMKPGKLMVNIGQLLNASINRSPTAYPLNPDAKDYEYDTDKNMTVLKFVDSSGNDMGLISWFAVHCTSMNNTNVLISGDNKGYASLLHEKAMDPQSLPGHSKFVAAYAQSNEGDVSPNIKGPCCQHTGKPCDNISSTCNGRVTFAYDDRSLYDFSVSHDGSIKIFVDAWNEDCIAFGPGKDMFDSTRIIGERQFNKGKELYDSAEEEIVGPIQYIHVFEDFSKIEVDINGKKVQTCTPAMGDSFAAGTIDGPGAFSFRQNDTTGNKFWDFVGHLLHDPSHEQKCCHHPKPILLDTGDMDVPYPWAPKIVPLQILTVGQLVIIAVPGEFTTMSGRRLRNAVKQTLNDNAFVGAIPVIAGLSNTYSDYIATYEEYQQQRYEAASTIFGPHTLEAYIQEFDRLAAALAKNETIKSNVTVPDYSGKQLSFQLPVLKDAAPRGKNFGDVKSDVKSTYNVNDTVTVQFYSGNPRNNRMTESTFLTVEQQNNDGQWNTICNDASFETRFYWKYEHNDLVCIIDEFLRGCTSDITIEWTIPPGTPAGNYRIRHFGYYKHDGVHSYSGISSIFKVQG